MRLLTLLLATSLCLPLSFAHAPREEGGPNTLSPVQIAEGWILLFDGDSTFGWKHDAANGDLECGNGSLCLKGPKWPLNLLSTTAELPRGTLTFEYRTQGDFMKSLRYGGLREELKPETGDAWEKVSIELDQSKAMQPLNQGKPQRLIFSFAGYKLQHENPEGNRLELRAIKYKPAGLGPIFNGKDLTAWKAVEGKPSKFTVTAEGELNIKDGPGDLHTEEQWDDFILQLDIKSNGKHLNSGVFFRSVPNQFWSGYEAQIRNQWQGEDRTKPVDHGTGGLWGRQNARRVVPSDGEWFTMTVLANGPHIAIWVNGYQTVDFTETKPLGDNARKGGKVTAGTISLQGHDPTTDLSFRNIRIVSLKESKK